jgi:hypothetical protein
MKKYKIIYFNKILQILLIKTLFCSNLYSQVSQSYYRVLPYKQSSFIKKLTWISSPHRYPGTNSDMHWWTWGSDSAIYVVDDDGKNFGGPDHYAHLLKCTGIPPNHQVETVTDFQEYKFRDSTPTHKLLRRYICGAMSVKNRLFACLYDYDWDIPEYPLNRDSVNKWKTMYNPWKYLDDTGLKNLGFIDGYSKLGGVGAIIYSDDFGKTWKNIPSPQTPVFFSPTFGAPAFLTFGPGNSQTPQSLRPYVYAISNDGSWETGNHVYLARVHQDSILNSEAWYFLSKIEKGNKTEWSKNINQMKPIFTDSNHVGHPTITYNPQLKRYILCISSDVVPHRQNQSLEQSKLWDVASEMQLYEGVNPWGPWYLFHTEKPWGGKEHTCYIPQIPQAWLSKDGLSGYVLFAGDYIKRKVEYYGFMTQKFQLELHKKKKKHIK